MSQSVSPPKILTKMVLTRGSCRITRKEVFTVSDVALPPVSRKLAHEPPRSVSASLVFIASPAPFTEYGQRDDKGIWGGLPNVPMVPGP